MDENIYQLATKLQESLSNLAINKELDELDKKMNDSFEVYNLSNKKDEALNKYLTLKDALGESHIDTIKALNELKIAKENLSNHPLVNKYLKVYSEVRDLYLEINNILFSDFNKRGC